MANQGFVHFDNSSVLAHTSGDAELIAKVDEGWIELKGESQRDYHVYEEGRLVTPTKWTLQGAWNKVRDSTNPKWYVEDVLHTQGDKPFITQGGDVYDNYPAIWESIHKVNPTSVKMYAKDHTTGVFMETPLCLGRLWVVVEGEVRFLPNATRQDLHVMLPRSCIHTSSIGDQFDVMQSMLTYLHRV
jgi:hypothetical protein